MATADVTIMGAGIFGLSIAWACRARGASVRVIDPRGVGAGSSGGVVGALAPHTPDRWNVKKAFQFESLLMAERFWTEVAEVSGQSPGYARLGRVQPLLDDRAVNLAQERVADAAQNWQGRAEWRVQDHGGGWQIDSPTGRFLFDTLTARVSPARGSAALAEALRVKGVPMLSEGKAEGAVVWATGYEGLLELSKALGRTVGNGVKGQAAVFRLDRAGLPQLFADALHIIPHEDGTVAIGSTSERAFDDPTATDAQLDALIDKARALVPELAAAPVIARWAGVRPRAKSRAPMLGGHPLRKGEYIANGGFKIGFGMASKVGQVMADLVLEGRDTIPGDFRVEASL